MKISVSSYSFQQYVGAGKLAHIDTIKQAHDMGFEAIEFLDMPAPTYEEQVKYAYKLREEAEKYGMTKSNICVIVKTNNLTKVKVGVRNLIVKEELDRIMESRRAQFGAFRLQ